MNYDYIYIIIIEELNYSTQQLKNSFVCFKIKEQAHLYLNELFEIALKSKKILKIHKNSEFEHSLEYKNFDQISMKLNTKIFYKSESKYFAPILTQNILDLEVEYLKII